MAKDIKYGYKNLPENHWFAHRYCVTLLDLLTQVVVEGEKAGIFNVKIEDESGELAKKLQEAADKHSIEVLEEDGRLIEVFQLLYGQVILGILSDMCHFLFEGLECSTKGKMTVSFALLRKPLTENLLYLEYLLSDPADFIVNFWKEDIQHFALGQKQSLDAQAIIRRIYDKYPLPQYATPDQIYEWRYKKDSQHSFQTYFQKATHLVTQSRHYKTEKTNFNFIYSMPEDIEAQWDGLYTYLPILLMHAHQVVEALMPLIARRAGEEHDVTEARAAVGFWLWHKDSSWNDLGVDNLDEMINVFDFSKQTCPQCSGNLENTLQNFVSFYEEGSATCEKCGESIDYVTIFLTEAELDKKQSAEKNKNGPAVEVGRVK